MNEIPHWLESVRVGDLFMVLWILGVVLAMGRWVYLPLAKKIRDFYSDWNGIQHETANLRSVLERHEQRQEFVVDNLMQLRKVNELKLRMEERSPITHPYSAPVPQWLTMADRVDEEVVEEAKENPLDKGLDLT